MGGIPGSGLSGRGEQAGLLVAAAVAPGTFAPSLIPRSPLDQGIVTGLATTLSYVLTVGSQDAIEAVAAGLADRLPGESLEARQRRAALLLDLAVIPAGLVAQRALPRRRNEPVRRGLLRQAAWRTTATGVGSATFALAQLGAERLDARLGAHGRIARFPVAVPVGLGLGYVIERRRRRDVPAGPQPDAPVPGSPVKAAAAGVAVAAALSSTALGEHALARAAGSLLAARLPGPAPLWRLTGHAACLGGLTAGALALYSRAIHRLEAGATAYESVLDEQSGPRWIGSTASGGPGSLVSWGAVGREGRRHAFAYVRPQPVPDRPAGLPDLSIETVMAEPAKATPIQVYVGLDNAPSAQDRVELALAEMDRTGAWDRALLMLVSPTGTGYVNYAAVAAAQYLTRGDMASVTLQYSKRPSPLSLGKIKDAREQNRLLWLHVARRLRDRAGPKPRVVLFGESLGAHTSQDVLMHWGTLGPEALGIERALWIGTPYASKWMQQVTRGARPDVDPDVVTVVNDYEQIRTLTAEEQAGLRYVLVSHDNDGVTKFGADLVASEPAWLSAGRAPVQAVPGASPRGVPPGVRWRPVTTFLQTMVDMKNAQIPGAYRAWAHDYRPDLVRFVQKVYGLPASEEQLVRIEEAVEQRESLRERIFAAESLAAVEVPSPRAEEEPGPSRPGLRAGQHKPQA